MSEILFYLEDISLTPSDKISFALILNIMYSKGLSQQESSLSMSIWNKKIMIMNVGRACKLSIFIYMYNSAVPCKSYLIVPAQLLPTENDLRVKLQQ